jgi:uncharacterized spore protein YtfJ
MDHSEERMNSFLEGLAQRLSGTATAATVFGAPVERGDVTVIPVARAAYGFGGGSGTRSGEEGSGGGGGVRAAPVGYIEIRPGVVLYRPIRDWAVLLPALAAGAVLTLVAARGIARLTSGRATT